MDVVAKNLKGILVFTFQKNILGGTLFSSEWSRLFHILSLFRCVVLLDFEETPSFELRHRVYDLTI